MKLLIKDIKIGNRKRGLGNIESLKESIKEIGLLNPITIDNDNNLIAGFHRINAYKELGQDEIECRKINLTGLKSELAEIDENLINNPLRWDEEAIWLKRRKEIYEELYPETKPRNVKGHISNYSSDDKLSLEETFTEDTSKKLGKSQRTIQRKIEIAELIEKRPELRELQTQTDVYSTIKKEDRLKKIEEQRKEIAKGSLKYPKGTYEVIVIDPPWKYNDDVVYDAKGFRGVTDYPTMTIEQIKNIKLPSNDNCVLWLWTTHRFMRYAFELLDDWGFEEKAILTWCKNKMGIGRWLRSKSEFCIMAVKGKPTINLTNQTTILAADNEGHSIKPKEFYEMVDKLCIGRKLDYFARKKRAGWDVYGDEV